MEIFSLFIAVRFFESKNDLIKAALQATIAQTKPLPGSGEKLPRFQGGGFLTTYLTIIGFGAHGDSGDESSKEHLEWNGKCRTRSEEV